MEKIINTILYIGSFDLPDKNAAAHRVLGNAKVLSDLGFDVILIGLTSDNNFHTNLQNYSIDGYSIKYINIKKPSNIIEWLSYILNLNKLIKSINNKIHYTIAYDFTSFGLFILLLLAKIKDFKIIGDSTEWYDIKSKNFNSFIKRIDVFFRMRFMNYRLDGLIVISDFLYKYYEGKVNKLIQIPPLIDTRDSKWAFNSQKNITIQIVYVGTPFSLSDLNVKDRLDLIIIALKKIKEKGFVFDFKIIGCDLINFINRFPDIENEINYLGSNISFLGKIEHYKAIEALKISDFSIFLRDKKRSSQAGFPTKFVEAISCGIPIITSENLLINKYLIPKINGFYIDMTSIEKIIETLEIPLSYSNDYIFDLKKKLHNESPFNYVNYINKFKIIFECAE